MSCWLCWFWLLSLLNPSLNDGQPTQDAATVVLVVGAPGTDAFAEEFRQSADLWQEAAEEAGSVVSRVGDDFRAEEDSPTTDRERLLSVLAQSTSRSSATLWLVFLGHGTFDGKTAKFNLRGPDVSAEELASWLSDCQRPLVVVNAASASGPFINRLSGPNRIIVTATKSGYEYNYARFGHFLAQEIRAQTADLDKDGQVSVLEVFLAASARTAEFYESEGRLATEHALIDDNGDGLGTPADWFRGVRVARRSQGSTAVDGRRAQRVALNTAEVDKGLSPEARRRRDELESVLDELRARKDQLDPLVYSADLETVLLELARLYAESESAAVVPEVLSTSSPTPTPVPESADRDP